VPQPLTVNGCLPSSENAAAGRMGGKPTTNSSYSTLLSLSEVRGPVSGMLGSRVAPDRLALAHGSGDPGAASAQPVRSLQKVPSSQQAPSSPFATMDVIGELETSRATAAALFCRKARRLWSHVATSLERNSGDRASASTADHPC
jgi:hypothetical protein